MPPRRPPEPDLARFQPIVAAALKAFAVDASYAIDMATRANIVITKRRTWESRKIIRAAEAVARVACSSAASFTCDNPAPCGVTRACRFSSGPLRELVLEVIEPLGPVRGGQARERPQLSSDGTRTTYNSEVAVIPFRDQQEASLRPA